MEIVRALLDPMIWQAAALDAVICVADARQLIDQPGLLEDALCRSQLQAADFVALTKTDLVRAAERGQVLASLRRFKPERVIHETTFGRMAPELLFSARLYQPAANVSARSAVATGGFQSVSWTTNSALAVDRFQAVINRFAGRLVRAKGLVRLAGPQNRLVLFQLSGRRATMGPAPSSVRATAETQIVFIAREGMLSEAELIDALADCVGDNDGAISW